MEGSHRLEIEADNAGIRVNAPLRNGPKLDPGGHNRTTTPTAIALGVRGLICARGASPSFPFAIPLVRYGRLVISVGGRDAL
jgi:hypothetical protein